MKVALYGRKEAERAFKAYYKSLSKDSVPKILVKHGMNIQSNAKQNAQALGVYDTGRLISSISTNWTGSGFSHGKTDGWPALATDGVSAPPSSEEKFDVHVGSGVNYAIFQEFGTKFFAGRPFLFPAYFSEEGEVIKDLAEAAKKVPK